jgi:hypothetical protein
MSEFLRAFNKQREDDLRARQQVTDHIVAKARFQVGGDIAEKVATFPNGTPLQQVVLWSKSAFKPQFHYIEPFELVILEHSAGSAA